MTYCKENGGGDVRYHNRGNILLCTSRIRVVGDDWRPRRKSLRVRDRSVSLGDALSAAREKEDYDGDDNITTRRRHRHS